MVRKSNSLSIASVILAVLAVLFCWLMPVSIMLASTSIGIALLSRGKGHIAVSGIAGIVISVLAAVMSVIVMILLFAWVVRMIQMYDLDALFSQFIRSIQDPEVRELIEDLIGGAL